MRDLPYIVSEFKKSLSDLGVKKGDILYFSSDLQKMLFILKFNYDFDVQLDVDNLFNALVNCLQEIVGEEGTLLFPVFTWNICRGISFDYLNTLGETGTLQNWILLNRKDFKRTTHPIYSFMVWGKDAGELLAMQNQESFGSDSPFQYLYDKHATQILFDVDAVNSLTFTHFVEQVIKVPFRHNKFFFCEYVDAYGKKEKRNYSMFVRDLDRCGAPKFTTSFILEKNAAKQTKFFDCSVTLIDLVAFFDVIQDDYLNNNSKNISVFLNGYEPVVGAEPTVPYEIGYVDLLK